MLTTWKEFTDKARRNSNAWATSDRGWLLALTVCPEKSNEKYTSERYPEWDADINGWRERSTLGNYLDYGPDHYRPAESREAQPGNIHCVCYPSKTSRYVETVKQAKAWIESEAKRFRPELFEQTAIAA